MRVRQYKRSAQVIAALVVLASGPGTPAAAQRSTLPSSISDREFWRLVSDFSEPGGYFRSDNFLSNELAFQQVLPRLQKTVRPGLVYLGVGPEQNFTYIAALHPAIAVIFDIRRQNMLEHLLYKELFELSADRVEFISRLFSRPRPASLAPDADVQEIFRATPHHKQVMMFSATLAKDIRVTCKKFMANVSSHTYNPSVHSR